MSGSFPCARASVRTASRVGSADGGDAEGGVAGCASLDVAPMGSRRAATDAAGDAGASVALAACGKLPCIGAAGRAGSPPADVAGPHATTPTNDPATIARTTADLVMSQGYSPGPSA